MIEAGRPAEAVQAFRRAIYLDPKLIVAHVALGQLLSRTGKADGARRAFRTPSSSSLPSRRTRS